MSQDFPSKFTVVWTFKLGVIARVTNVEQNMFAIYHQTDKA